VRFDQELQEFEAVVCGEVEGWGSTAREAAAKLQECILWRATVAGQTQAPATLQIAHNALQHAENHAPATMTRTTANRPRIERQREVCPHWKVIKRAFAIMRERGLNHHDDEAMRAAFSRFFCRNIESREVLTGEDWRLVGNAIKARRLAW